jgi:hypothetical protein
MVSKLMLLKSFFVKRSSVYHKVKQSVERRTLPVRKPNIVLMKDHAVLQHSFLWLEHENLVTIRFELQMHDLPNNSVTHAKTGHSPRLSSMGGSSYCSTHAKSRHVERWLDFVVHP